MTQPLGMVTVVSDDFLPSLDLTLIVSVSSLISHFTVSLASSNGTDAVKSVMDSLN